MSDFGSVHAALQFAWRLEHASVKPSELAGFLKGGGTRQGGPGLGRMDMAAQAALIRKVAGQTLGQCQYLYCVARYSTRDRERAMAIELVAKEVAQGIDANRPWLERLARGQMALRWDRSYSQAQVSIEYGLAESTVSKWAKRVSRELRRLHHEVDNALFDTLAERGVVVS